MGKLKKRDDAQDEEHRHPDAARRTTGGAVYKPHVHDQQSRAMSLSFEYEDETRSENRLWISHPEFQDVASTKATEIIPKASLKPRTIENVIGKLTDQTRDVDFSIEIKMDKHQDTEIYDLFASFPLRDDKKIENQKKLLSDSLNKDQGKNIETLQLSIQNTDKWRSCMKESFKELGVTVMEETINFALPDLEKCKEILEKFAIINNEDIPNAQEGLWYISSDCVSNNSTVTTEERQGLLEMMENYSAALTKTYERVYKPELIKGTSLGEQLQRCDQKAYRTHLALVLLYVSAC